MWRIAIFAVTCLSLAGCAGETLPDQVAASAVSGTSQAVIDGLARGSSVLVQVKLNNPEETRIQISTMTMQVVEVRPTTCPTTSLKLASYPKPIIAGAGSGEVLVKVALDASAAEPCSKARWVVKFASEAVPAS